MHDALAVDVFAGGLAVGVRKHFDVVAHLEHSDYRSEVVKLNHPDTPIYNHLSKWPRQRVYTGRSSRVRFICANPPCAPFSTSVPVRSKPWNEDPRVQMFQDSMNLLPDIEPDVMAVESVCPAWTRGTGFGQSLAKQAASHGYATTVLLHNAQHLGVPQHRKRLFYVFHRIAVDWDVPDFAKEPMTVRQAWKGLKIPAKTKKLRNVSLSPEYERLANHTAQGEDLADAFDRLYPNPPRNERGQVKRRPSFLTHRIEWDKPSSVVLGDQKMIHPTEPRSLYPEELAALVGFPRDYKWPDGVKMNTIALMMSQGVSPVVGEWLAAGVARSIDRGRRLNRPFLATLDYRTPAPEPYQIVDDDPESYSGPDMCYRTPQASDVPPWEEQPVRRQARPAPTRNSPPGTGSGAYIREMLLEGKLSADAIVAKVLERFPDRKTSKSDVAWNRGKLRKEGLL